MDKKITWDLVAAAVLIVHGAAIIIESVRIARDVGGAFIESPGLMPAVLGTMLLFASVVLAADSARSIRRHHVRVGAALSDLLRVSDEGRGKAVEIAIALALMALYTFVLLPLLPFWASSFLFIVMTMLIIRATSWWKAIIIAAVAVGSIELLFGSIFRVPLP